MAPRLSPPVRFHGTATTAPIRAAAGLAFITALALQLLTIGCTFRGLVQDDISGCLLYTLLAAGLSLTLPVFWTLSRR